MPQIHKGAEHVVVEEPTRVDVAEPEVVIADEFYGVVQQPSAVLPEAQHPAVDVQIVLELWVAWPRTRPVDDELAAAEIVRARGEARERDEFAEVLEHDDVGVEIDERTLGDCLAIHPELGPLHTELVDLGQCVQPDGRRLDA